MKIASVESQKKSGTTNKQAAGDNGDLAYDFNLDLDPRGQRSYFILVILIEPDPTVYDLFPSAVPFRR